MKFYGELLVFVLLFITNFRVFFVRSARHDPLVVLAPSTFIIAVLQFFSFGIDVFTTLGLLIALMVLLSNFHAMFRYSENLYIDHYSPLMMIWAILTSIFSAAAIAGIIIFAPLELKNNTLKITEEETRLKGNFRSGFEAIHSYTPANAFLYKFSPLKAAKEQSPNTNEDKIIIFIPDKRGDTTHYKPYLQLLAQRGFTVYSADFFADDCRWLHSIEDIKYLRRISMVIHNELEPSFFTSQREFYTYNISLEINALINLLSEKYGKDAAYYFVSDVMGNTAIEDLIIKQPSKVKGKFFLDSVAEYQTAGFGFIKQTDPILAFIRKLDRDRTFKEAKMLSEKTEELFSEKLISEETEEAVE